MAGGDRTWPKLPDPDGDPDRWIVIVELHRAVA